MVDSQLSGILKNSRVIVLGGSGGVGKTTTAAAIGVYGAIEGRSVAVLTIDPARRLGAALGFRKLGNALRIVPEQKWKPYRRKAGGSLSAAMLDAKGTFDQMVRRHAPTDKIAQSILANPIYEELSHAMSGTHEYMALEKIYEIHASGEFDLLVLDTPPSSALTEFFAAPARLKAFFDESIVKWFSPAASRLGRGMGWAFTLFQKISGGTIFGDISTFIEASQSLFTGVLERAEKISLLMRDPGTSFLIVSTTDLHAHSEAIRLSDELRREKIKLKALILNRTIPNIPKGFSPETPGEKRLMDLCRSAFERQSMVKKEILTRNPGAEWIDVVLREKDPTTIEDLARFF